MACKVSFCSKFPEIPEKNVVDKKTKNKTEKGNNKVL